jgi:hypothetical protein
LLLFLAVFSTSEGILSCKKTIVFDSHGPYSVVENLNVSFSSTKESFEYPIPTDIGGEPSDYSPLKISDVSVDGQSQTAFTCSSGPAPGAVCVDLNRKNDMEYVVRYRVSTPAVGYRLKVWLVDERSSESNVTVIFPKPINPSEARLEGSYRNLDLSVSGRRADIWCYSVADVYLNVAGPAFFFAPTGAGIAVFAIGVFLFLILGFAIVYFFLGIDCYHAGTDLLPTELSQLLIEGSDARQALLFLASIDRLTQTIDAENATVGNISPAEKDDSRYSWLLRDLTTAAGESGVVRNESLTRLMYRANERITRDASQMLMNLQLTRRVPELGLVWCIGAALALSFILFLIEPAFAERNWAFPGLFVPMDIMISVCSAMYFLLSPWMRLRRYWILAVFITWVVQAAVAGGWYSLRACTWDMMSGIVWAGVGNWLGIVLALVSRDLTLKGIREAGRGLIYLRKLNKTAVDIGPEFQRWLSYQGGWNLSSDDREPWSFWTNWLRRSAARPRVRRGRNQDDRLLATMGLVRDLDLN